MHVLIAPSGFKESLSAPEVAACMQTGVQRALPSATTTCLPLVDGGEGFTQGLTSATDGTITTAAVTGPVGQPVTAPIGILGGQGPRTAVIELAAAAGLSLVPADQRNPLVTTSYGFGQLISSALDLEPERLLIGLGDSGVNDGGAGMAQALGVALTDSAGRPLPQGGGALRDLHRIDDTNQDPRLGNIPVDVACNPYNVLCGPDGVANVFAPQKGATPDQVEVLSRAMDHYAEMLEATFGIDVADTPGGGASGGVGAGLIAFANANLQPRFDVVFDYLDLDDVLDRAELVLTGEGSLDSQTPKGKVPAEVARRAEAKGIPTIALAGTLGQGVEATRAAGVDAYTSVLTRPTRLEDAISDAATLLTNATEQALRIVNVGMTLAAPAATDDVS